MIKSSASLLISMKLQTISTIYYVGPEKFQKDFGEMVYKSKDLPTLSETRENSRHGSGISWLVG